MNPTPVADPTPPASTATDQSLDPRTLVAQIRTWGRELGFQQVGISDCDLHEAEARLEQWLAAGRHGELGYMARHGRRRSRPALLLPGTRSVISVRMDYLPEPAAQLTAALADPATAFISRYALGRDYHKVLRRRLARLATRITEAIGPFGHRAFVDSAPVLEKPLAAKAGLGWIGKHTNLINREAGSWFFLGELYCDLPLPADTPTDDHCGRCTACAEVCPTGAIVAPYQLDARRCISYLTIELAGSIPAPLRPLIGNRIYGCDDCQLVCPWNRFARLSTEADFQPRYDLDHATLIDLFGWDEPTFLARTEGSAIRRIGHLRWLRNLAVALGNLPVGEVAPDPAAPPAAASASAGNPAVIAALASRADHPIALVREHVAWAIARQRPPAR